MTKRKKQATIVTCGGYRLSRKLILDNRNVVRNAETLEPLGVISFLEGKREHFLEGLEATHGTTEDGPIVSTPELRTETREVLRSVGVDPADFGLAEDDREYQTYGDGRMIRISDLISRDDGESLVALATEALVDLPVDWDAHVTEPWFLEALSSIDLAGARKAAREAGHLETGGQFALFRDAVERELAVARNRHAS